MAFDWKGKAGDLAGGLFGGKDDDDNNEGQKSSTNNADGNDGGDNGFSFDALKGKANDFYEDKKDDMSEKISDKKEDIKDKLSDKKDDVMEKLSDKKDDVMEKISDKKEDIMGKMSDKKEDVMGKMSDKKDDVMEKISDKKDDVMGKMSDKKDDVMEKISDKKEDVEGKMSDKKEYLTDKLSDKKDNVMDKVSDKKEDLSGKMSDDKGGFPDRISDKKEDFSDKISDKKEEISDKISDKIEDFKNMFGNSDDEDQAKESSNGAIGKINEEASDAFSIMNAIRSGSRPASAAKSSRSASAAKSRNTSSVTSSKPASATRSSRPASTSKSSRPASASKSLVNTEEKGENTKEENINNGNAIDDDETKENESDSSYTDELNASQSTMKSDSKQRYDTPSKKSQVDFRQHSPKSDVILKTKDGDLYCNKAVLIMWSGHFKRRFLFEFKGMRQAEIDLDDDVSMDEMEELLRVIYPPNKPIDETNVESIIVLAQKFESKELARRSQGYLMKVKPSTELMLKSLKYDLPAVQRRCVDYLKMQPSTKWTPPADFLDELDLTSRMKLYTERIRWLEDSANSQAIRKTALAKARFEKVILTWSDFKQLVDSDDLDRDTILDLCTEALEIASKNPGKVLEKPQETPSESASRVDDRPPFDLRMQAVAGKNKLGSPRKSISKGLATNNRVTKDRNRIKPGNATAANSKTPNVKPKGPKQKSPYKTGSKKKPSNTSKNGDTKVNKNPKARDFSEGFSKHVNEFSVAR